MSEAILILTGCVVGAALVLFVISLRRRHEAALAERLIEESHKDRAEELGVVIQQLETKFAALSREALSTNADDFLKLARTKLEQHSIEGAKTLEEKKKLIDARLEVMGAKLGELNELIQRVEKQRSESHGSLKGQLERTTQATNRLQETTGQLREALANPQHRGQWGERMAEDVLRLAGFIEGVNYVKQQQVAEGTRPDFTFKLPDNRQVHMDVKFPLANYLKMLNAEDESTRTASTAQFLRDVRSRIKEVTTREYINPAEGTVDYVLVFIPNEQVYAFIHERDSSLLDDAMRSKVVLCSPMTLYAILAVIRQATDNFRLEQTSRQVQELLSEFNKQWRKYTEGMDKMGERLKAALKEYENLVGVRTRQLDRNLDKIEDLRASREEETTGRLLQSPTEVTDSDSA